MKVLWRAWDELRNKETGCGWKMKEGMIDMPDEWWEAILKESDKYKRFRTKPPDPELSELWDMVYGNICATGNNCVSATMDVPVTETPTNVDGEGAAAAINLEELEMENEFEEEDDLQDICGFSQLSGSQGRPSTLTSRGKCQVKRRKIKGTAATQYKEHMKTVEHSNERLLSLIEGEISSSAKGSNHVFELHDAIDIVDRMVKDGRLVQTTKLWCFVVDELNREESRRLFMTLKSDDERMAWLDYKYEEKHPHSQA